ncbi:hypothetical protein ACFCYF_28090 [Streptomyces chartreusis]|uniref:hypothetical protein n=1 Tax=Streptomyces chartreusis TaxID=1969 RepID=UPI002E7FE253|nr:hypothetical protein [Streptomyces chartreusis]WUB16114.1 hypothetical protein OG997_05155 [Streptomyces chartreusis]
MAVVMVAGLLGLAGCASEQGAAGAERTDGAAGAPTAASPSAPASPSTPSSPTPATPPSGSPRPSPVPVTGPDQLLVTMEVTGGFAGVQKEVALRGDGTVHTTDKGERAVRRTSAAQFTELRTLLGDPALDDVSDFTKDMQAADLFQYTLRFGGRTVRTDLSAEEPALDRLVHALSAWLPK